MGVMFFVLDGFWRVFGLKDMFFFCCMMVVLGMVFVFVVWCIVVGVFVGSGWLVGLVYVVGYVMRFKNC